METLASNAFSADTYLLALTLGSTLRRVRSRTTRLRQVVTHSVLYALPARWRAGVAARIPVRRLVPDNLRPEHLDELYSTAHDPYGFDSNDFESLKYQRTLELCGDGRLGRVFEIGCSIGTFTELIAPRSEAVLATDVSALAVERARTRLAGHANVTCEVCDVSRTSPPGPFDTVVASDVLYLITPDQLLALLHRLEGALTAGGRLVAVHYVPRIGSVLTADETHDLLRARTMLAHVHEERTEFGAGRPYRIDVFERRSSPIEESS